MSRVSNGALERFQNDISNGCWSSDLWPPQADALADLRDERKKYTWCFDMNFAPKDKPVLILTTEFKRVAAQWCEDYHLWKAEGILVYFSATEVMAFCAIPPTPSIPTIAEEVL